MTTSYGNLLDALREEQEEYGYLPEAALLRIAERFDVSSAYVLGVATFYSRFRFKPAGKWVVTVCMGTACHVNGGRDILNALKGELGVSEGETTTDMEFTLETAACLGCCGLSPVMTVNGETFGGLTPESARGVVKRLRDDK